jgi:hypothetical protein
MFPTPAEFHDDVDPHRNARYRSEFGGIHSFPFASVAWGLLAVHPALVGLAAELLDCPPEGLRVYSIEAWAKFTGAADYDQHHHRDYLNHTLAVPDPSGAPTNVEMFLYLSDVPTECGPPHLVPLDLTRGTPALPNWFPRIDGDAPDDPARPGWVSQEGRPAWYEHEVAAAGPAGTVLAYRIETFHRGSAMTEPGRVRYTIHAAFRRAECDWIGRRSWVDASTQPGWAEWAASATPEQLALFGFPPQCHPFWTNETREDLGVRYPGVTVPAAVSARDNPTAGC